MSQEIIQRKRRKQRQRHKRYTIRVRYKYHIYRKIRTRDFGTFEHMYNKYKNKYTFWCGDLPPEKGEDGETTGHRLDGDAIHTESTLKRYGRHKCWIDENYKFEGKSVCLVYNAAMRYE